MKLVNDEEPDARELLPLLPAPGHDIPVLAVGYDDLALSEDLQVGLGLADEDSDRDA